MTRELAMVHAREGIRINSICPYVLKYNSRHDHANSIIQRPAEDS